MKGLQFKIDGDWAHFKKPETNNNPLSHDLIPKTREDEISFPSVV